MNRGEAIRAIIENHWQWCHDCGDCREDEACAAAMLDVTGFDELLAAALALRDAWTRTQLNGTANVHQEALADTEWLEEHRG